MCRFPWLAVTMTTTGGSGFSMIFSSTRKPDRFGSIMSSTTASGFPACQALTAVLPSVTLVVRAPSARIARSMLDRISSSSSTISTVRPVRRGWWTWVEDTAVGLEVEGEGSESEQALGNSLAAIHTRGTAWLVASSPRPFHTAAPCSHKAIQLTLCHPWQPLQLVDEPLGHRLSLALMLRAALPAAVQPQVLFGRLPHHLLKGARIAGGDIDERIGLGGPFMRLNEVGVRQLVLESIVDATR